MLSMHGEEADFSAGYEDVLAANRLAALIYFTCQGNLFLQAGEEFGRTKLGDENSYCAPPELNMLDWSRAAEYSELVEYYRGLIRLRKKLPGLCEQIPLRGGADRLPGNPQGGRGVLPGGQSERRRSESRQRGFPMGRAVHRI